MALNALLFSGIAGAATLAGISIVQVRQDLAIKYSHYVNSFAAGALISLALAHLIPESVDMVDNALFAVLASFIAFYLLEIVLVFHSGSAIHYVEHFPRRSYAKGPVIFSGFLLHSFVDGVIIAIGFEGSFQLGLFAAGGVILHELPEGITSFTMLMRSVKERTALVLSVAVALATPIGAVIALGPLSGISEAGLGIMMALAGGSFLYVAASDLIPETHEGDVLRNFSFFLIGASFLVVLGIVFE